MNSQQMDALIELRGIDKRLHELDSERNAALVQLRAAEAKCNELEKTLSEMRARLAAEEAEIARLDKAVHDDQIKLRKWESRLPDMNSRDMVAMQREIEEQRRQNDAAELNVMQQQDKVKALRTELDGVEAQFREYTAQRTREQETVREVEHRNRADLDEHSTRRKLVVERVSAHVMAQYDRLNKRYPGNAVVGVTETRRCTGCNMSIPPQHFTIIVRGTSAENCPSCHRILFYKNSNAN